MNPAPPVTQITVFEVLEIVLTPDSNASGDMLRIIVGRPFISTFETVIDPEFVWRPRSRYSWAIRFVSVAR